MKGLKEIFNTFPKNVPLTDKSGSWFLETKCAKNSCGTVEHLWNQLPGFYISGILAENGLRKRYTLFRYNSFVQNL